MAARQLVRPTSTGVTLTLYAMPEFWLGMILLIVLSTGGRAVHGHLPERRDHLARGRPAVAGRASLNMAWHLVLPVTTLTLIYLAEYSLVMRSSLLDEIGQDYLPTARAKGLMDRAVRRRHAVPNALLPTITLVFLNIGFIVSGAITVETVFSWPGLGLLSYDAIRGPGRAAAAGDLPALLDHGRGLQPRSPTCSWPRWTRGCGYDAPSTPRAGRAQRARPGPGAPRAAVARF